MRTHLGNNKSKGEYVGLFGKSAVLENFWCYPLRGVSVALSLIRFRSFIVHDGGEAHVRETGTTRSIHKDILLYQFREDHAMNSEIKHRRLTDFRFRCSIPYEWRWSRPRTTSIDCELRALSDNILGLRGRAHQTNAVSIVVCLQVFNDIPIGHSLGHHLEGVGRNTETSNNVWMI